MDCARQRIATSENVEPVTSTACAAPRRTPSSAAAATSRPEADGARFGAMTQLGDGLFYTDQHEDAFSVRDAELSMLRRLRSLYGGALYIDPGATLDDLREAVSTLEETERIARRVLGGAHPNTVGIEASLQNARTVLLARETQPS